MIGETIDLQDRRSSSVKQRIAGWAASGFLIAGFWALYFARASKDNPTDPIAYALACFTQPIALVVHRLPVSFYWVLLANTVTYALVGLGTAALRQKLSQAK